MKTLLAIIALAITVSAASQAFAENNTQGCQYRVVKDGHFVCTDTQEQW
jgi:hypothetical protein